MSEPNELQTALASLDACDEALTSLESRCCMPERSPRMQALAETLAVIREGVDGADPHVGPESIEDTLDQITDAGAQIGWLQVGCCAPNRLPLYHTLLEELTTTRRSIRSAVGSGH